MERAAHWPWAGACEPPDGLSGERLWRWCVLRTLRDARLARARGRWMSRSAMERRFARRWAQAMKGGPDTGRQRTTEQGRAILRRAYDTGTFKT